MRLLLLLFSICFINSSVFSQKPVISGYIHDLSSGEVLIGANVLIQGTGTGTTANSYGFFSLSVPKGKTTLRFSYVGYTTQIIDIEILKDTILNIRLEPVTQLQGVEISADAIPSNAQSSRMGTIEVPVTQIKKLPKFLGEADVLKTIQLLPGVQSGTEGTSGFYVRGGGPDQNLILLDGVPVYNANHLFGFFSVFNADAINHIELVKGGFPARYGGRLSSVLDIRMKEGNQNQFKATGTIGLISSKLTVEGPLLKGKTSFILSGRRSYLDYLAQPIMQLQTQQYGSESGYYFADVNAKINHTFSKKDRIYLSLYTGDDRFYQNTARQQFLYEGVIYEDYSKSNLGWGNLTSALRWSHQFNSKLFGNATVTYSKFKYSVNQDVKSYEVLDDGARQTFFKQEFFSGIADLSGRYDFDYIPAADHYIKAGAGYTYHIFSPGASVTSSLGGENEMQGNNIRIGHDDVKAGEYYVYAEDDYHVFSKLKVNAGLRLAGFSPGNKNYISLEPRITARYLITPVIAIKGSYSRMNQFVHLLTNNNIGLPTDLWVPATDKVPPLNSSQYALGVAVDMPANLRFSFETYYKSMNHVIEYKEGSTFLGNFTNWEEKVESGKGWSYGGEFLFEKPTGMLTGWIGYTLAWTMRQFPSINEGKVFPYKYDRRHDVSLVMNYKIDDKWDVSLTWVYGTGNAITMPTVVYLVLQDDGTQLPTQSYHERNSYRAAAYHRLDLGFNNTKKKKWGDRTWSFGLYNAYNRKNPFYYNISSDYQGRKVLQRVSLFPVIPSVSYSFTIGKN